jgi:transforming growth factor-beta-induced protein
MKKIFGILMTLLLTLNISVFAAEGDIVDIAVGDSQFSTLVAALTEADLVSTLQGDGPFTVFAPTDAAFAELLAALGIEAGDLLAHPQLADVLLYHVVSGKVMSTDLSDGMMAPTVGGEEITVDLSNGVKINSSNVIAADIEATNGVIHVIDTVLVPESFKLDYGSEDMMEESMEKMAESPAKDIVDIALADEQFSMLVMLLQRADLVGALQGDGPFTVFAPTNDAFVDLVTALGITPSELMAQPDLANVLLYHVVSGKVMSTDLSDGLAAPTLLGESITFDLSSGVMANNASVIAADIEASNGVIHVIDTVLVPEDFTYEEIIMDDEEIPKTSDNTLLLNMYLFAIALSGLVALKFQRAYAKSNR